jgi:hypothetical protein
LHRAPPLPSTPTEQDKGKRFPPDPFCLKEEILADLLPPLDRFAGKERKEKDTPRLGSLWLNFNFKIEFVCKSFENLPKIDFRGFKHNQKIKAQV